MTTIGRVSAKPAVVAAPSPSSPDGAREVRVSSPDRVLWPAAGMADGRAVTKLDLAEYLVGVADPMLRALGDRPVTLQRFPEGIEGEEFFSKNPPKGVPEWTRTVMCTYPSGRKHPQLVGPVHVGRAHRPRVEGDGVHLGRPHGIGDLVDDELRVPAP